MPKLASIAIAIAMFLFSDAQAENIKISTESYPPYTSEELENGGLLLEIISRSFRASGIEVDYYYSPAARSYELARSGQTAGTAPWALREDRKEFFYYSDPLIEVDGEHLYYLKPSSATRRDLTNSVFAIINGHNYGAAFDRIAEKHDLYFLTVRDNAQALELLIRKRVDFVLCKKTVCDYLIKKKKIQKVVSEELIGSNGAHDYLLISKKYKGAEVLLKKFNEGMTLIRESGVYDNIISKYQFR